MDDINVLPMLHRIVGNEQFLALTRLDSLYEVFIQENDDQIVKKCLPLLLSMNIGIATQRCGLIWLEMYYGFGT